MFLSNLTLALSLSGLFPDGSRLQQESSCFTVFQDKAGQASTPIFNTYQTVSFFEFQGKPSVKVMVRQRKIDGKIDIRDDFILDAKTLRPISFTNHRNGQKMVNLEYSERRITGSKTGIDGKTENIDVALDMPVWEGNLWGILFGSLPLQAEQTYQIPYYQHDKGLGQFDLKVIGSEMVSTADGMVEAWMVELARDGGRKVVYLIDRKNGRELGLRSTGYSQKLGGDCSAMFTTN